MKMFKILLKLSVVFFVIVACVPQKRYYEVEAKYKTYKSQRQKDSTDLEFFRKRNGEQLMHLMSLREDSIRYHYAYDSLMNIYHQTTTTGSMEIANIRRQLDDKDLEVKQKQAKSQLIVNAFNSVNVEANAIYKQLNRYIYKYESRGARIYSSNWTITISLPDDLMFDNNDFKTLSSDGKNIVSSVAGLLNSNTNFQMDIAEDSKSRFETIVSDTIVTYKAVDTLYHTIKAIDTTQLDTIVPIQYEVERFRIGQKENKIYFPASMQRGSAIVGYLEGADSYPLKDLTYFGKIIVRKQREYGTSNGMEIIITPKIKSLLKTVGAL